VGNGSCEPSPKSFQKVIQPPGGFFTKEGDPAPGYWIDDLKNLHDFAEGFYAQFGKDEVEVKYHELLAVPSKADAVLRSYVRIKTPSVFQSAAAFTIGFMHESPLRDPFGPSIFGQRIGHIDNHQNAIVAFEYSITCLHGATYICGEKEVILNNPIKVSEHFYADTINAFATLPRKGSVQLAPIASAPTFHAIALLYESLAYQDNPSCCNAREI
jgi:hypothetical protein